VVDDAATLRIGSQTHLAGAQLRTVPPKSCSPPPKSMDEVTHGSPVMVDPDGVVVPDGEHPMIGTVIQVGPGRYCSTRHKMPSNSSHEGSQCVG